MKPNKIQIGEFEYEYYNDGSKFIWIRQGESGSICARFDELDNLKEVLERAIEKVEEIKASANARKEKEK